ncbi:hypothetical protein EA677_35040, partial [Acinetobacter baumannii]
RSGDPLAMLPDEVDQSYLRDQVVIVGYGGVGRRITENLINQNLCTRQISQNPYPIRILPS